MTGTGSVGAAHTARDEGPTGWLPGLAAAAKEQHAHHDTDHASGRRHHARPGHPTAGDLGPPWRLQFLAAVARALKPGARFVLDTGMVAESLLPSLARTRWFRLGDILMLSENRYHPEEGRLDIDYTFVRNGHVETRPTASYLFTAGELCRIHRGAGLRPTELLGSLNGEAYQIGSPRLILISTRE